MEQGQEQEQERDIMTRSQEHELNVWTVLGSNIASESDKECAYKIIKANEYKISLLAMHPHTRSAAMGCASGVSGRLILKPFKRFVSIPAGHVFPHAHSRQSFSQRFTA
jgi:hypothetical protein